MNQTFIYDIRKSKLFEEEKQTSHIQNNIDYYEQNALMLKNYVQPAPSNQENVYYKIMVAFNSLKIFLIF